MKGSSTRPGFARLLAVAVGARAARVAVPPRARMTRALPRQSATRAAGFGAAGVIMRSASSQREDGVVGATVAAGRDRPDVAGVLAERMPDPAFGFERVRGRRRCRRWGRAIASRSPWLLGCLVGVRRG